MNPDEKPRATERTGRPSAPGPRSARRPGSPETGRRSCRPPPGCPGRCFNLLLEERLLLQHLFLFSRAGAFQTALPLPPGGPLRRAASLGRGGIYGGRAGRTCELCETDHCRRQRARSSPSASFLHGARRSRSPPVKTSGSFPRCSRPAPAPQVRQRLPRSAPAPHLPAAAPPARAPRVRRADACAPRNTPGLGVAWRQPCPPGRHRGGVRPLRSQAEAPARTPAPRPPQRVTLYSSAGLRIRSEGPFLVCPHVPRAWPARAGD